MDSMWDQSKKEGLMGYDLGHVAVGRRCAVDFSELALPVEDGVALGILRAKGFESMRVDIIGLARDLVGQARYEFRARYNQAPHIVNCSRLIAWLYAQLGIGLPRLAIEQYHLGEPVAADGLMKGDLVFKAAPRFNYFLDDPRQNVGHVGLATGEGTIIHAANPRSGVVESRASNFVRSSRYRGARRLVKAFDRLVTLVCPDDEEVFSSSHLRWKILQSLPHDL